MSGTDFQSVGPIKNPQVNTSSNGESNDGAVDQGSSTQTSSGYALNTAPPLNTWVDALKFLGIEIKDVNSDGKRDDRDIEEDFKNKGLTVNLKDGIDWAEAQALASKYGINITKVGFDFLTIGGRASKINSTTGLAEGDNSISISDVQDFYEYAIADIAVGAQNFPAVIRKYLTATEFQLVKRDEAAKQFADKNMHMRDADGNPTITFDELKKCTNSQLSSLMENCLKNILGKNTIDGSQVITYEQVKVLFLTVGFLGKLDNPQDIYSPAKGIPHLDKPDTESFLAWYTKGTTGAFNPPASTNSSGNNSETGDATELKEEDRKFLAALNGENGASYDGTDQAAIDRLETMRSSYPNNYLVIHFLTDRYIKLGKYEKALEIALSACKANEDNDKMRRVFFGVASKYSEEMKGRDQGNLTQEQKTLAVSAGEYMNKLVIDKFKGGTIKDEMIQPLFRTNISLYKIGGKTSADIMRLINQYKDGIWGVSSWSVGEKAKFAFELLKAYAEANTEQNEQKYKFNGDFSGFADQIKYLIAHCKEEFPTSGEEGATSSLFKYLQGQIGNFNLASATKSAENAAVLWVLYELYTNSSYTGEMTRLYPEEQKFDRDKEMVEKAYKAYVEGTPLAQGDAAVKNVSIGGTNFKMKRDGDFIVWVKDSTHSIKVAELKAGKWALIQNAEKPSGLTLAILNREFKIEQTLSLVTVRVGTNSYKLERNGDKIIWVKDGGEKVEIATKDGQAWNTNDKCPEDLTAAILLRNFPISQGGGTKTGNVKIGNANYSYRMTASEFSIKVNENWRKIADRKAGAWVPVADSIIDLPGTNGTNGDILSAIKSVSGT